MLCVETKQGYIARVNGEKSDIFTNSGERIYKDIPTIILSNSFTKYQVILMQNHLFIGWKGLIGGGNCANPSVEPSLKNNKKRPSLVLPQATPQPSIKSSMDIFLVKDDLSESKLKINLNIFKEKLKIGEPLFTTLKEIENEPIISNCNFLSILSQILEILAIPFLYYKKEYVQIRAKLAVLARKFAIFTKIVLSDEIKPDQINFFKESIEKALGLITNEFFPEVYFECNLVILLHFIDNINTPLHCQLVLIANTLLASFYKGPVSNDLLDEFLATRIKLGLNCINDLMLLEFISSNTEISFIQSLIDFNLSSSWERIGVILTKVSNTTEGLSVLGDYLYFNNTEIKEVWKVRYICLEILFSYNYPYNKETIKIEKILEAKLIQQDEEPIKKLVKNTEFYKHCLSLSLKTQKFNEKSEYLQKLPKIPQSQCETSNLELLLRSSNKVISITGPAGSGKTTLALTYAYSKLDFYYLIFFIPSQSDRLILKKFIQLSRKLKLIIQDCAEEMISAVKRYLNKETRPFLLIFDGVESIETIKKFIPTAGHIIITSPNNVWPLRYEIFPLEENFVKVFLAEFYSSGISDGLKGNYMAIGLAVRLLKNKKIKVSELEKTLLSENSISGVLSMVLETLNKDIPGCKDILFCLCLLENTYIPRDLFIEICVFLKKPQHYFDLFLMELEKYKLIEEYKNFTFVLSSTFYNYLSSVLKKPIFYINILKQAYFSIHPECCFLNISKLEERISILLMKFSQYLVQDCSVDTGTIFFLKGKYEFQIELNLQEAVKSFEHSLKCLRNYKWQEQAIFGLGCSYLKDFRAADSISMFIQAIESSLDPEYKLIINAFLVRAYDYIGNSSKIAEIIIHTADTNFQQLTLPEAVYCTIHGICSLSLNEQDLQEFLLPYSSFLYSRAPSITLFVTLLKLSHTFAVKKQWRTVFNYVNLITPLVQIESIPCPNSNTVILEILEHLLISIKTKVQDIVGDMHRMVALLYLILAKVYQGQGNAKKVKENLKASLKIRKENFGKVHIFVADLYFELGKFYYKYKKNGIKTVEYAKQAEKIVLESGGEEFLIYSKITELYGLGYMLENDLEKASVMIHRALLMKKKVLAKSTDNNEILLTYSYLGKLEKKQENC